MNHRNNIKGTIQGLIKVFLVLACCTVSFTSFAQSSEVHKSSGEKQVTEKDLRDVALTQENVELFVELAYQYGKMGNKEKAIDIYHSVIELNRNHHENWQSVIYGLYDLNLQKELTPFLEEYVERFPYDTEQNKALMNIYLYQQQRTDKMAFYYNYVRTYRDVEVALDTTQRLLNQGKINQARKWANDMITLFPENNDIYDVYVDILITEQRHEEAQKILEAKHPRTPEQEQQLGYVYELNHEYEKSLKIYEKFLDENPSDPETISKVSYLYYVISDKTRSKTYYAKLADKRPGDVTILKFAAKEIMYLGDPRKALEFLYRAKETEPNDPEIWHLISEAAAADLQRHLMMDASKQVIELYKNKPTLNQEETRHDLKAKGRLAYSEDLSDAYQEAFLKYPKDIELSLDWIELLIQHNKLEKAEKEIAYVQAHYPEGQKRLLPSETSIAVKKAEWEKAITLLKQIIDDYPDSWSYRPELAEAYSQTGRLRKAIDEFSEVQKHTDIKVAEDLRILHEVYDQRVTSGYEYIRNGSNDGHLFKMGYQGFLNDNIQPSIRAEAGTFNNNILGITNKNTIYGEFSVNIHKYPNLIVSPGIGYGASDVRDGVSPFLIVTYREPYWLLLQSGYRYQMLVRDIPYSVTSGALESQIFFLWSVTVSKRVVFSGQYQYLYDTLPAGESAQIHEVTPGLAYIISDRPYVTVGYVYYFRDLTESGAFLAKLPVLSSVSSHSIVVYASHHFAQRRLFVEGSVSTGVDPVRNIDMFGLWAVSAAFKWAVSNSFDIRGYFSYNSETVTGFTGESYNIGVDLSGHWD